MSNTQMRRLRHEYRQAGLNETVVPNTPISLFKDWFDEAVKADLREPNGMALATASADGRPSVRIVLLKDYDAAGFVFFTNYVSRKGLDIGANPHAAATFWWPELERQVRIEGKIAPVSAAESDAYFYSRPRGSQLGAWASPQSRPIPDRDLLERNMHALKTRYDAGKEIPRPHHWGGMRLSPAVIEFWQGRPSRLHDRLRYRLVDDGRWVRERLAP